MSAVFKITISILGYPYYCLKKKDKGVVNVMILMKYRIVSLVPSCLSSEPHLWACWVFFNDLPRGGGSECLEKDDVKRHHPVVEEKDVFLQPETTLKWHRQEEEEEVSS